MAEVFMINLPAFYGSSLPGWPGWL